MTDDEDEAVGPEVLQAIAEALDSIPEGLSKDVAPAFVHGAALALGAGYEGAALARAIVRLSAATRKAG